MNKKLFKLFIFLCILFVVLWILTYLTYVYINKDLTKKVNSYDYDFIIEV